MVKLFAAVWILGTNVCKLLSVTKTLLLLVTAWKSQKSKSITIFYNGRSYCTSSSHYGDDVKVISDGRYVRSGQVMYCKNWVSGKAGHGQDADTNSDANLDTDLNIFVMLNYFCNFCITLALYYYFTVFIDPC